jgi:S-adenosylmethionine:tRNA ribosyltransferase-isomerase
MRTADFDYHLPPELIAQEPMTPRDAARLMVLERSATGCPETRFSSIGEYLRAGDLLVLNDTRVFPARLIAGKASGGRVEILLVARDATGEGPVWTCLVSTARGIHPGARLAVAPGFEALVLKEVEDGRTRVRLEAALGDAEEMIRRHGSVPLPPYIRREAGDPRGDLDRERYQTIYAREPGAIAAPTAGLHFTADLLEELQARRIGLARLTLHVGPGTFLPVRAERIEDHRIEPEAYTLPPETVSAIGACRARGGRVVAVGTTVTRVLEACAGESGLPAPGRGWCALYIRPGHRFRVVDGLITNFHLPRSSLLILVSAFAGRDRVLAAYREAVARSFRFYSYGDAMLLL